MTPHLRRTIGALAASFLVYAIPLPGPHAVPLLGGWIVGMLTGASKNLTLGLATVALALAAQVVVFLVVRWASGLPRPAFVGVLLVMGIVLVFVVNYTAQLVIPRWTLIARDTTPENLSWPVACTVPNASVESVRSPLDGALAREGMAWLRTGADATVHARFDAACGVVALEPPARGTMHAIAHAVATGATLETTWDVAAQRQVWWWRRLPTEPAFELKDLPEKVDSVPILSNDGVWLVVVVRPQPPPAFPTLHLIRLGDRSVSIIPLRALGNATFVPVAARIAEDVDERLVGGEIDLCRNDTDFVTMGLDGHPVGLALAPEGVDVGSMTLRRPRTEAGAGWVAWDAYVEGREYALSWSLPGGKGRHVVPKGRGITSVDVDPEGRWLALSTSPVYSLGGVDDAVTILSLPDGAEVFRDALPAYARSDVAFVGPGLLAYTAWDGGTQAEVRCVRAP